MTGPLVAVGDAPSMVRNLREFRTRGRLRAEAFHDGGAPEFPERIPLPNAGSRAVNAKDRNEYNPLRHLVTYVVFSYDAPCAWVLRDGRKFVAKTYLNDTFSGHASMARDALNVPVPPPLYA